MFIPKVVKYLLGGVVGARFAVALKEEQFRLPLESRAVCVVKERKDILTKTELMSIRTVYDVVYAVSQ